MPENRRAFDKVFENKLDEIIDYNKRQDKLIGEIHEVIHGNGNPEDGLIVKHTRTDERSKSNARQLAIHWALIVGIFLATAGAVLAIVL